MNWRIIHGDALEQLRELPDRLVQTCITSPPYYSLRDYNDPGQIGLEPTPDEYIQKLVAAFREVRRVLRDDGTVWLNLGDSYAGAWGRQAESRDKEPGSGRNLGALGRVESGAGSIPPGADYKAKDLLGIPWLVALALRSDGWYLRSDIIWAKPNPMPESVTDRPTKSHEYLFLLSKGPRYFYDADAIREDAADPDRVGKSAGRWGNQIKGSRAGVMGRAPSGNEANATEVVIGSNRNKRSVWHIATQPFPDAHFACVDEATDCLTAEGWKHHDELEPGMLAAQFDMESQTLSWAPVGEVARYDVANQEMVVGQRRDMSMVLTPNHRCVIQRRHNETRKPLSPVIVRADELKPSHVIPTAAPWIEGGDSSIPVEWAELLGWYIAEGLESQQTLAVEIYQSDSANPEKVQRIEALLRQVGAEWTAARVERRTDLPQGTRSGPSSMVAFRVIGYVAARLRELAAAKRIPPAALMWSQDRIAALLDGLINGDGHRRPDGRMSFIQKDDERAGMVQALALRLGLSAHLTKRPDGINTVYLTKHSTRSFRGTAGYGTPLGRTRYTGVVWCPRLPAGTWLARRDGKPFITGNTFPPKLIEPCVLAGSSPKACGECGAPWERVTERTTATVMSPNSRYDESAGRNPEGRNRSMLVGAEAVTLGFKPSCSHNEGNSQCESDPSLLGTTFGSESSSIALNAGSTSSRFRASDCGSTVPSVVLDPFAGAGTTGLVATRFGRSFIGIELNESYCEMARNRIRDDAPLFNWANEVAA